ncbi:hypothetical protein NE237_032439 [Protea cynaroides]|uniref:Uncharacterized protein n=1 Tax=Protea cynaroides TaxID=273540 RepID=A0A9Q0L3A7_9MAGN|nr:hypothetical protein NE237_032439 [Protea cynaroides]
MESLRFEITDVCYVKGVQNLRDYVRKESGEGFNFFRYKMDMDLPTDDEGEENFGDEQGLEDVPQVFGLKETNDEMALVVVPIQVKASQVIEVEGAAAGQDQDKTLVLIQDRMMAIEALVAYRSGIKLITEVFSEAKTLRAQLSESASHINYISLWIEALEEPWAKQVRTLQFRAEKADSRIQLLEKSHMREFNKALHLEVSLTQVS